MLAYRSTFSTDLKALLTLKSERAEQRAAFFRDFDQTERIMRLIIGMPPRALRAVHA